MTKAYQRTEEQYRNEDYGFLSDPVDWTHEDEASIIERAGALKDFVKCFNGTYWVIELDSEIEYESPAFNSTEF